ncbi:unnamed protein product, partial [Ectocarpus sp. 8 AP-2014]
EAGTTSAVGAGGGGRKAGEHAHAVAEYTTGLASPSSTSTVVRPAFADGGGSGGVGALVAGGSAGAGAAAATGVPPGREEDGDQGRSGSSAEFRSISPPADALWVPATSPTGRSPSRG